MIARARDSFGRSQQEGRTTELPTGTVTLLFTDIEGSTRLLDALGNRYGDLLHDHYALILSSVEKHRGSVLGTEGDGCFIVFQAADDAVAAAAAAQRSLAGHRWPDGVAVRVRMGMHTGSPMRMDAGYVGMDVHRAARISSTAQGGQVIASVTTVEMTARAGIEWADLGRYRLKDLKRPEHLFQLVAPGLEKEFGPPRAPRWGISLPEPPTRFIGRAGDIARLDEMLGHSDLRLVTLVGPGGIGKTRLAIHVADQAANRFMDGTVFVPLANATVAYEIVGAIGAAVGGLEAGAKDLAVALYQQLRDQELLLILDNLEHLPAAAPLVSELLRECRHVRVLATSRAPLGVPGEHLFPVRPLQISDGGNGASGSDAIALFVDRARAIVPSFEVTPANVRAVEEICRRADGIPLAIELAAAHIATLSPHELLDRLTIDILTGGSTDVDQRQQTLRATIDWSYRLLGVDDREAFRGVSVFAGGATMAGIEAVIDPESRIEALGRVETLVRQSLLWRDEDFDGTSRFRMLGTVRDFAYDQLEQAGERAYFSNRHATHLLDLMATANEHIEGPDAELWLARIESEMPNLKAALNWTLEDIEGSTDIGVELVNALSWYWYLRDDPTDGLRWLDLALELGTDSPVTEVRLVYYSAAMLERLGRLVEAEASFEEALAMFRALSDQKRMAMTLNSLGGLAVDRGDAETAFERLNEGERIMRAVGDEYGLGVSLVNLCDAALSIGDHDLADRYGQQGLELFVALENEWGAAVARRHLAKVAYSRGDLPLARALLLQALEGSHGVGDRPASVRCFERLAGVEVGLDSPLRGARLAAAAAKLRQEIGDHLTEDRRQSFDQSWAEARVALGDEEFEAAWAQGTHMTFDQAAEYALTDGV